MVAVVVGDTGSGKRSAVAATLLSLAQRNIIRIEGLDSRRYTLTVPPESARRHARSRRRCWPSCARRAKSRRRPRSPVRRCGARMPTASAAGFTRVAAKQAYKNRLLRLTLAMAVLLPASITMGVVALIGSGGTSVLAWIVAFAGPIVGLAAARLTGANLTSPRAFGTGSVAAVPQLAAPQLGARRGSARRASSCGASRSCTRPRSAPRRSRPRISASADGGHRAVPGG